MNRRGLVFRLIVMATLAAAIIWLALQRELLEPATIERELGRFGDWAPIVFLPLYALAATLFVPGALLTVTGGALFGSIWGTLGNLTGAALGATMAFVIARYVASGWVATRDGERLGRLMRGVEEEGWRFVAFVRLVPLFPFNLVNYGFGLTRIRLRDYILASFVCMAPGALAYNYLGYAGREAASGQAGAIRKALLAVALLAAVAFLPRLVRSLKPQRFTDPAILKRGLESDEEAAPIDVRSAQEFSGPLGHIAGASNIPIAELSLKIRELSEIKRKPIIAI
ncbi:MAG: VTT domain-containing protein [Candidatus Binataceae bacterium]